MSRLVIDTNSLVQIIPRRSRFHFLWERLIEGEEQLCVTTEILEEYREIISRLVNEAVATNVIQTIINNPSTIFVTTYFHFNLIEKDPDDNKFVDCAIAANAKCIVTNDHHFDVLRSIGFPKIEVVRLEDFDSKGLNA